MCKYYFRNISLFYHWRWPLSHNKLKFPSKNCWIQLFYLGEIWCWNLTVFSNFFFPMNLYFKRICPRKLESEIPFSLVTYTWVCYKPFNMFLQTSPVWFYICKIKEKKFQTNLMFVVSLSLEANTIKNVHVLKFWVKILSKQT